MSKRILAGGKPIKRSQVRAARRARKQLMTTSIDGKTGTSKKARDVLEIQTDPEAPI